MKRRDTVFWGLGVLLLSLMISCGDKPTPEPIHPVLRVRIHHTVDGEPIVFDQLRYENEAGNPYLVSEIQYFLSDLALHYKGGETVMLNEENPFHYVDTDLTYTLSWPVTDPLKEGVIEGVSLRLGFRDAVNESFMFPDPPERDMFWPEHLGGGYHYMKLNGKWIPADGSHANLPFNFHLGRGQLYDSLGTVTAYVDNSMPFAFQGLSHPLKEGDTLFLDLTMQVENWFRNPHAYDHDAWGGFIMSNQEAMRCAVENSHDVFNLSLTTL